MTAYSGPPFDALRAELTGLVTHGLTRENVVRRGGQLTSLRAIVDRVEIGKDADEDEWEEAVAEALIAVLGQLATNPRGNDVVHVYRKEHRRVLRSVLPLKDELKGKSLDRRREASAKEIGVKASTARTYYEPRALDDLTRALIELEAKHRGEDPPPRPS
jgi:hypothetical protein